LQRNFFVNSQGTGWYELKVTASEVSLVTCFAEYVLTYVFVDVKIKTYHNENRPLDTSLPIASLHHW